MASYQKRSHLFGDAQAELIDDRHLRIQERRPYGRPRAFMVDVACLAPDFAVERPKAWGWLLASAGAAVCATLAGYLASNEVIDTTLATSIVAALLLVAVTAGIVWRLRGAPILVLATRYSGVPLLRISPFRHNDSHLAPFLDILRARIAEAETKRGLNGERLRSGEVKTLRRLAKEKVLTSAEYEKAKHTVLFTSVA